MEKFIDESYEKFKKFYSEIYRGLVENDIDLLNKNDNYAKKLNSIFNAILRNNRNLLCEILFVEKCTEQAVDYVNNLECITDNIEIEEIDPYIEIDSAKLEKENFEQLNIFLTDRWKKLIDDFKKQAEINIIRKNTVREYVNRKIPQVAYLKLLDEYDKLLLQYLQKNQKTLKQRLYLVDDLVKAIYEEREDFIKSFDYTREFEEEQLFESSTEFQIF